MNQKKIVTTFGNAQGVSPTVWQRNLRNALVMGVLGATVATAVALAVSWRNLPGLPAPKGNLPYHVKSWGKSAIHSVVPFAFADAVASYKAHRAQQDEEGVSHLLTYRVGGALCFGALLGGFFFYLGARPTNGYSHTRGRKLLSGKEAVRALQMQMAPKIKSLGADLMIHPEISFTADDFTKHLLYMGTIGGGKTTALIFLLKQAVARGDRALIFDVKGDFTQKFPNAMLIAPWDARGTPWLIGADCTTRQDAREFAAQCIPDSKDPMWAQAARQVFVGIIVMLQAKKPGTWGWLDLADAFAAEEDELVQWMQHYNKEALTIVAAQNQTTSGVLINMRAGLSWISDLGQAWGNPDPKTSISFVKWLLDDNSKVRQIILQGNGRFETMMQGYVGSIIAMLMARINSPQFSDSRTRRLWFILDEFPQLGKVKYQAGVEVGRSKGVRMVFGLQDISQVRKIYSEEDANALMSNVGTKIIAQISPGETAKKISELIGQKEVERLNISTSSQQGGASTTAMLNREEHKVILESELATELGNRPSEKVVRALMLSNNLDTAVLLDWGWDTTPNKRKAYVEADWVNFTPKYVPTMAPITEEDPQLNFEEEEEEERIQSAKKKQAFEQAKRTVDAQGALPANVTPSILNERNARIQKEIERLMGAGKARAQERTQTLKYEDEEAAQGHKAQAQSQQDKQITPMAQGARFGDARNVAHEFELLDMEQGLERIANLRAARPAGHQEGLVDNAIDQWHVAHSVEHAAHALGSLAPVGVAAAGALVMLSEQSPTPRQQAKNLLRQGVNIKNLERMELIKLRQAQARSQERQLGGD
jgi:hypothetical protein